jgi:hypothetical protein
MQIRIGATLVLLAVLGAIAAPLVGLHDPAAQTLPLRLEGPSLSHPLGCWPGPACRCWWGSWWSASRRASG